MRVALRQVKGIGVGEGALNGALIVCRRAEHAASVRRATHLHQLGGSEAVRQLELLGQDRDAARQRIPRPIPHRASRHLDRSALGPERTAHEAQQGRLAAAVGTQQRHHLPGIDGEVHVAQDRRADPVRAADTRSGRHAAQRRR